MFFLIKQGQIIESNHQQFLTESSTVALFTKEEWKKQCTLKSTYGLNQVIDNIHFCKVERHIEYLFGTCYVPVPNKQLKHKEFVFYILEGKLIFVDDSNTIQSQIHRIIEELSRKNYTLEHLVFDILTNLIDNDLLFLEILEQEIGKIEEYVLRGILNNFNAKMLEIKKMISKLYRYYSQMTDLSETLIESHEDFFLQGEEEVFRILSERTVRLKNETQILREYAMQVQDVYQSEIGIRQNNVMKVLTIVTTIFLPLTLIVGWYGMNFRYMPELGWKYGYPAVIGLSIVVIIGCLLLFKKKKYW